MKNAAEPIEWHDAYYVTTEAKPLEFVLAAHVLPMDVKGDYNKTRAALLAILRWRASLGWAVEPMSRAGSMSGFIGR
jgi:hypothetical protein